MWPWALCEGECGGLGASRYLHLVQELHNTAMHSILCARHTCLETEDGQSDDAVGFGPHQHLSLKVPPALQSQTRSKSQAGSSSRSGESDGSGRGWLACSPAASGTESLSHTNNLRYSKCQQLNTVEYSTTRYNMCATHICSCSEHALYPFMQSLDLDQVIAK